MTAASPEACRGASGAWSVTWRVGDRELAAQRVRGDLGAAVRGSRCGSPTRGSWSPTRTARCGVAAAAAGAGEAARGRAVLPGGESRAGDGGRVPARRSTRRSRGSRRPPLLMEQDVLVTDGPTVFAPGTARRGRPGAGERVRAAAQGAGAGAASLQPGADGGADRRGRVQAAAGVRLDPDRRRRAERAARPADGRRRS